ncbi:MAG: hypothetical protein GY926_13430, partial [bacterium]|nr:hypothetical protein [bacterium]
MNAYRVSPANRRIILLAVMSLIASLLTINFNAPGARATGETTSFTLGVSNPEEGDGTHPVTATLTFSDPTLLADVTVPVSVNGTSSAGDPGDYTLSTTSFVFSSGATSPATATINVLLTNNTTFEGDETIILDLGTPDIGGTTAPLQHIVTISDAVDTPTIAINSIPVYEDDGTATFTVTRSGATNQTVTADWATANGTATSP